MKKLLKKLQASKGETLVETLVAMMILSLVSALLFVMINGSFQLNSQAATQDQKFYQGLTDVENKGKTATTGNVTISYGGSSYSAAVKVYESNGLSSYVKEVP